jgi:hypothetical protein
LGYITQYLGDIKDPSKRLCLHASTMHSIAKYLDLQRTRAGSRVDELCSSAMRIASFAARDSRARITR